MKNKALYLGLVVLTIVCFITGIYIFTRETSPKEDSVTALAPQKPIDENKGQDEPKGTQDSVKEYDGLSPQETLKKMWEKDSLSEKEKELAENALRSLENDVIKELDSLLYSKDYDVKLEKIKSFKQAVPKAISFTPSPKLEKLEKMFVDFTQLEEYTGVIEHIFVHPLIAFKELAFDGDYQAQGLDDYFTTVPEFKRLIAQLYEKGYILIDIRETYEIDQAGQPNKAKLMLPKGKKPIVFSVDDLNFYPYMKEHGMVHGLEINGDGKIVTYTNRPDGTRLVSDDNECVPILDKFVEENPDFSWGGAKGILALTGYSGTFDFATHKPEGENYQSELEKARVIADKLKTTGWSFASHSYGHGWPQKQSLEKITRDNRAWGEEVRAVVGETDVYIYPYGEKIDIKDPKHKMLVDSGFKMFCGVQGKTAYFKDYGTSLLMQRRNIDGIAMKKGYLDDFLDISQIIDADRPGN